METSALWELSYSAVSFGCCVDFSGLCYWDCSDNAPWVLLWGLCDHWGELLAAWVPGVCVVPCLDGGGASDWFFWWYLLWDIYDSLGAEGVLSDGVPGYVSECSGE